jgi:SAM-dependent methyltransferase
MSDPVATPNSTQVRWHRVSCAWRTLKHQGWWTSLRMLGSEWWFDLRRGTETWWPAAEAPEGGGDTAVPYQGVPPRTFRELMAAVPEACRDGTFVDLGCGKGRALVMAAELGYRRLIGVDLDPALVAVCRRNLLRIRSRSGWIEAEVRVEDATRVWLPTGPCVVFLYNPFRGETFARVAANLAKRGAENGNAVWVVYVNPLELGALEGVGFQVVHRVRLRGRVTGAVLQFPGQMYNI